MILTNVKAFYDENCVPRVCGGDPPHNSLLDGLQRWLVDYQADHIAFDAPGQDANLAANEKELTRLTNELSTIKVQQSALYDLLEQGVYDKDLFLERSRLLAAKATSIRNAVEDARKRFKNERISLENQRRLVPNIKKVLAEYETLTSPTEKNDLLKEVLEKVIYSKSVGGRWAESDMQLFLFPKLKADENTLSHA